MCNHIFLFILLKGCCLCCLQEGKSGRTLLHEAADANNGRLIDFLLCQANIRVDARTYAGYTPLRLASGRSFQDVAQTLIARGADQSQLALDDCDSCESDDDSVGEITFQLATGYVSRFV